MIQENNNNYLSGLLANKSALQKMEAKSIAKIVESVKQNYDESFLDILEQLPKENLLNIILLMNAKNTKDIFSKCSTEFLYSAIEHANDEDISEAMESIELLDEKKFRKLFDKLTMDRGLNALIKDETKVYKGDEISPSIKLYYNNNGHVSSIGFDMKSKINIENLIWVDLYKPTMEEIELIEEVLGIEIPTVNEREEIEISSRYWEEEGITTINSYFTTFENDEMISETISLILKDSFLVSVRFRNLKSFEELNKKIVLFQSRFTNGVELLLAMLDIRIDLDADMLEKIVKDISILRKSFMSDDVASHDVLLKLSKMEDLNAKMRESLQDKSRILVALIKNQIVTKRQNFELKIMIKDVSSLIVHVDFNFERLDSIQNITLASISIKQGKNITILTIANVLFLPPTLIASLYGMNFHHIPELNWEYGYMYALGLMVLSAVIPYWLFKMKAWL